MKRLIITFLALSAIAIGCAKDDNNPGGGGGRGGDDIPRPPIERDHDYLNSHDFIGALNISDRDAFEDMLQDFGICDFEGTIVSFGNWNCSNYNASYVSVYLDEFALPTSGYGIIYQHYGNYTNYLQPLAYEGLFQETVDGFELYRPGYVQQFSWDRITVRYKIIGDITKPENGFRLELHYRNKLLGTSNLESNDLIF